MRSNHVTALSTLRFDLFSGATAAIVALPLALAFGVASGAGPIAGLYGAIFIGIFASLFGGTPLQVSGPTGPMTVVMASIITQFSHDPALAFTVVMLGGLFQILFGLSRIGTLINFVPAPVVSGFMTGIGIIIIILELGPLLGITLPTSSALETLIALYSSLDQLSIPALLLGVSALLIILILPSRLGRIVPPPLLALIFGTVAALILDLDIPVIGQVPAGLPTAHLPTFELQYLPLMLKSALVLAVLGSIDSLLTSIVADNLTKTQHDSNKELVGQGIGNMVAGLFGGLPGAGATMRTVINIQAGGKTRLSGVIHGLCLLFLVIGMGGIVSVIPHAVLAGILISVGYDIIDWKGLKRVFYAPKKSSAIMLMVLFLTVFIDLMTAVGAGVVLASLLFVYQISKLQEQSILLASEANDHRLLPQRVIDELAEHESIGYVHLSGPLSFGAAKHMYQKISLVTDRSIVIIDLSDASFIDSSAALSLEGLIEDIQDKGGCVYLCGASKSVGAILNRMGVYLTLKKGGRYRSRDSAIDAAFAATTILDNATAC